MIDHHLHIDITKYETKGDLIEIRFQNEDTLQVNFRILSKSGKSVNPDLLFEFIFQSKETRFILIKFVSLDKLSEEKLEEMIEFIEEQEEETKNKYLDYIPFSISLIKKMKNKYEQVLKETKEKFEEEKMKREETINEMKTIQERNEKLLKENEIYKNASDKQNKENEQLKQQITDFQTRIKEEEKLKENLDKCKKELKQTKDEINRIKNIFVAGNNTNKQLGCSSNNKNKIISPLKFQLDPSPLLSYSSLSDHSVLLTSDGLLKGIGYNNDGRITSSLKKTTIDHFTDFCIKDGSGRKLDPFSVVCCEYSTLYICSKIEESGRQLVLCDESINGGNPVFLNIGNHNPVALFGGQFHSASICSEGEVIFINRNSVKNSPESPIEAVFLPDGEKASSVACCNDSVVVLSLNGRVFSSPVYSNSVLKFSEVAELKDKEIVCVSGTYNHFIAVSKEGQVFGRGSNGDGRLGLGDNNVTTSSFEEISSLRKYEIMAAYAGYFHSLFQTREGKILSCGYNVNGELLLRNGSGGNVYSPTETMITEGATFCIAGRLLSVVFIGNSPPPNLPNKRIQQYE